jgi:hypothetical protein
VRDKAMIYKKISQETLWRFVFIKNHKISIRYQQYFGRFHGMLVLDGKDFSRLNMNNRKKHVCQKIANQINQTNN